MFFNEFNMDGININQEVLRICENHTRCINCPLKDSNMETNGLKVSCETGKSK